MEVITYKTLMQKLKVSKSTAQNKLKQMRDYYKPKSGVLTMEHFYDYFSPPDFHDFIQQQM